MNTVLNLVSPAFLVENIGMAAGYSLEYIGPTFGAASTYPKFNKGLN